MVRFCTLKMDVNISYQVYSVADQGIKWKGSPGGNPYVLIGSHLNQMCTIPQKTIVKADVFRAGQIDMNQTRKIRTALHSNTLVFKILRKKVVFFNELWVFFLFLNKNNTEKFLLKNTFCSCPASACLLPPIQVDTKILKFSKLRDLSSIQSYNHRVVI